VRTDRALTRGALLERAALRIANDDRFMASAFRDWTGGDLDFNRTAPALDCAREAAVRLALCMRPRRDSVGFRADVARLAKSTGIDEARLAAFIREADSLAVFRRSDGREMLAAARDASDPEDRGM
jgi:hypothetical protein